MRSILLLPLEARCIETIDVCIWRMFVFMSVVVTVWGSVGSLLCSGNRAPIYRNNSMRSIPDKTQVTAFHLQNR